MKSQAIPALPHETVFIKGSAYFDALIKDIQKSKKSIDMEMYFFNKDTLGKQVQKALIHAAHRGVKIRILVDGVGTPFWSGQFVKNLDKAGIISKVFHPYPWGFRQSLRSVVQLPFLLKIIYLTMKINTRNHRKIILIDRHIAYTGSLNITSHHLELKEGGKGWCDSGIRLNHKNLDELYHAFEATWNHLPTQEKLSRFFHPAPTQPILRLNNTWHRRRALYKNLLKRIAKTQKRIWITNAYFIPNHFLIKKLCDAAYRKIDVRILLPHNSDVAIMPFASRMLYKKLLKAGVRIFEYLPSMLHTKNLILDNWVMLGTSNLNHRSLLHDLEIDVVVQHNQSKQILEKQFIENLKKSKEIHLSCWQKRPLISRLVGSLLFFLRYWF